MCNVKGLVLHQPKLGTLTVLPLTSEELLSIKPITVSCSVILPYVFVYLTKPGSVVCSNTPLQISNSLDSLYLLQIFKKSPIFWLKISCILYACYLSQMFPEKKIHTLAEIFLLYISGHKSQKGTSFCSIILPTNDLASRSFERTEAQARGLSSACHRHCQPPHVCIL